MLKSALVLVIFMSFQFIEAQEGKRPDFGGKRPDFGGKIGDLKGKRPDWMKMPSMDKLTDAMGKMIVCYMKYNDEDGNEQEYKRTCPENLSCQKHFMDKGNWKKSDYEWEMCGNVILEHQYCMPKPEFPCDDDGGCPPTHTCVNDGQCAPNADCVKSLYNNINDKFQKIRERMQARRQDAIATSVDDGGVAGSDEDEGVGPDY